MVDEETLHPDLTALRGTKVAGRYRVDEFLGVGGMGAVFKGRHLGLERDVAIKVLHPELTRDPEISARFEREAHSASRLDHPNCMQVTDVGTTDGGLKFMVMQLLEGRELAETMGEVYPPDRAVLLCLQILSGLEHAHEKGVVHRDIKPENIFVTRDHASRETLKLVDFGIAKLVGASDKSRNMTKAGLVFGTPAYMSPEQAMGQEADARADLYSVGIILYEMLAGEQPFVADDPVALVRMQVSTDPPPLPKSIPPSLEAVVTKLLQKQREQRYQSAVEARLALEEILPAIATSDITGLTMYPGHTGPISVVSGPIALTGSGPISVSMSMHGDTSSQRLNVATMPPVQQRRDKSNRVVWSLLGGGLAAVVVVLAVVLAGSDGEDKEGKPGSMASVSQSADTPGVASAANDDADDEILIIDEDGPTDAQLAQIDRLILAKKVEEADKLLGPLLDRFPDHALLIWRHGRLLVNQGKKKRSQALAAYGKALEKNASLIEDRDFYAELASLMRKPGVRDEALDLALRHVGASAHTFLLELVNDERKPLAYEDRHRALEELSTNPENATLVNSKLNRALDVLQARQSRTPCQAYRSALDAIAAAPDYYFYPRVEKAELPTPTEGQHLSEAEQNDAARCEDALTRREEVLALLASVEPTAEGDSAPVGEGGIPASSGTAASSKSGGSKSGGSKSGGSKSGSSKSSKGKTGKGAEPKGPDCGKFGAAIVNKKCR